MDLSPTHDLFDADVATDEELPRYDAHAAPPYELRGYFEPLYIYHLRQTDRKFQRLVPHGHTSGASYDIKSRGFSLFSKKPDLVIKLHPYGEAYAERRVACISMNNEQELKLPWRPQARVVYTGASKTQTQLSMEARDFHDWTLQLGGSTYTWALGTSPACLVLSEKSSSMVLARWTYSGYGTNAKDGGDVGELVIYPDGLSSSQDGVEMILVSLLVPITHFKNMGRWYRNANYQRHQPERTAGECG